VAACRNIAQATGTESTKWLRWSDSRRLDRGFANTAPRSVVRGRGDAEQAKGELRMMNRICTSGLLLLAIVVAVCGCGRSLSVAQDRTVALRLLNQVCMGSLSPIQSDLEPSFQRGNPDSVISRTSTAIRQQFGAVRDLKLQSAVKAPMNSAEAIWTVTAERGNFEMKVNLDRADKIVGLWFRSSSSQAWTPSHALGSDYAKGW
jgi:hypothetical protein